MVKHSPKRSPKRSPSAYNKFVKKEFKKMAHLDLTPQQKMKKAAKAWHKH
jgi:hypothetical protein